MSSYNSEIAARVLLLRFRRRHGWRLSSLLYVFALPLDALCLLSVACLPPVRCGPCRVFSR